MSDAEFASVPFDSALHSSPGAKLTAARQAYGLTVEQIANELNLAPRQVVALEADDYAALPAVAIARGFLRSYAKLVRLDPALLVAMLAPVPLPGNVRGAVRVQPAAKRAISEEQLPVVSSLVLRSKTIPVIAGVTGIVAAAIVSYAMGWLPGSLNRKTSLDKTNAVADNRSDSPAGFSGTVAVGTEASGAAHTGVAMEYGAGIGSGSLTTATGFAKSGADAPTSVGQEVLPAVSIGLLEQSIGHSRLKLPPSVAPANPLVLSVKKDSWVEIKRGDNTAVVAKILKGGSIETFDVSEPLTLTIGNAAGVEASLRGTPLALTDIGSGNVARLKLK